MRIEELVLEGDPKLDRLWVYANSDAGFKSYPVRTQITGWDSSFNAITGLNGSGKSNILDAICFVLGITNMSQVRVLHELASSSRMTRILATDACTKSAGPYIQARAGRYHQGKRNNRFRQLRSRQEPPWTRELQTNHRHKTGMCTSFATWDDAQFCLDCTTECVEIPAQRTQVTTALDTDYFSKCAAQHQ